MTTLTWPATLKPRNCLLRMSTNQRVSGSPFGGSEQAVDLLNDRWLMSVGFGERRQVDGALLEAFANSFRGLTNVVGLWHFIRPAPRGTMRGTLTLSGAVAQGASALVVTGGGGQAGTTLKAGDMLGVASLLFQVQDDATANGSGVITVNVVNRVRTALSNGAAVTWDKPTALFRLVSSSGVQYVPGRAEQVTLDFAEYVA